MVISAERETEVITEILRALGLPSDHANIQASTLVEGDLRGHPSHGIRRLPVIVERLRRGLMNPQPEVRSTWLSQAVLRLDGDAGSGPVVARIAIDQIADRSRHMGLAIAVVQNSSHLGMLAVHAEAIAVRGLIGVVLTTSEALVHPWGGTVPLVGTNPIAVAVPTEPEPFVLDMATGATSMGRILDYAQRGMAIPVGWALDELGLPTTNAAHAARGAISPFGGAKGYGLGLAFELLVGVLTLTAFGRDIRGTLDVTEPCTKGDLILCVSPDAFDARAALVTAAAYLDAIRTSPPQNPDQPVQIPGDGARRRREAALRDGVWISDAVWEGIVSIQGSLSGQTVN